MEQLKKGDHEKVPPLIRGMLYNLILSAVIDGTSPGKIYVDDLGEPHTAFICTVEGYYTLGECSNGGIAEKGLIF